MMARLCFHFRSIWFHPGFRKTITEILLQITTKTIVLKEGKPECVCVCVCVYAYIVIPCHSEPGEPKNILQKIVKFCFTNAINNHN